VKKSHICIQERKKEGKKEKRGRKKSMEEYTQIKTQQGISDRSHQTSPNFSSTKLLFLTYHLFTEREYHFKTHHGNVV